MNRLNKLEPISARLAVYLLDVSGLYHVAKHARTPGTDEHELNQAIGHLKTAIVNLEAAGQRLERAIHDRHDTVRRQRGTPPRPPARPTV